MSRDCGVRGLWIEFASHIKVPLEDSSHIPERADVHDATHVHPQRKRHAASPIEQEMWQKVRAVWRQVAWGSPQCGVEGRLYANQIVHRSLRIEPVLEVWVPIDEGTDKRLVLAWDLVVFWSGRIIQKVQLVD